MLECLGHHTLVVSSGSAALDVIRSETRIDLVVTDHAMPTMTGSELADQIRRIQPDLPIILVSGYTEQSSNTRETYTPDGTLSMYAIIGRACQWRVQGNKHGNPTFSFVRWRRFNRETLVEVE
jgi:CheY-like chemotaxis protein